MTSLSPLPKFRATVAGTGAPLVGGQLFTYKAGTSAIPANYLNTYRANPGAANTNPVILNSYGECDLWLLDQAYKFVLQDSVGNTLWTVDNITSASGEISVAISNLFIDTWADISNVLPTEAGQIFTLAQHTSGGFGGGTLMAFTGNVTDDGGTQKNALGGFYLKRINYPFLTFAMFGAVGDGVTDDTSKINSALALQQYISGENKIYAVSGNISLPYIFYIENAEFKQLTPNSSSRRTLFSSSSTFAALVNVKVNRNGTGTGGALSDAAGIWIASGTKVLLQNVEVYGNDYGNGIAIIDCNDAVLDRPYVHDITGGNASAPVIIDDSVQGIWIQRGNNIQVINPRVKNLRNIWTGQPSTPRFTRGISCGGTDKIDVEHPFIFSVDQGIDFSGGENPTKVNVTGGKVVQCATWGLKCANSVTYGQFSGVVAENCGLSGFVANGPTVVLPSVTSKLLFINCFSLGTGYPSGGAAGSTAGFRTISTGLYPSFPSSVRFVECRAEALGQPMQYGFLNDATFGGVNAANSVDSSCVSIGATVAAVSGFGTGVKSYASNKYYGGGFINPSSSAALSLTANTLYAIPFEVTYHSQFSEIVFVVSTLAAGSARVGIYSWNNGKPDALILDAGAISVGSAGVKSIVLPALTYLTPGMYALAIVSDVAPQVYSSSANIQAMESTGLTIPGTADTQLSRAFTYGALPATFGSITYTAANSPNIFLRAS